MNSVLGPRPAQLAGMWYPASAKHLASEVDCYIERAELEDLGGQVVGIMSPHAGYMYSGPVAGYAFAAIKGLSPQLVVVLSPMHQPYYLPVITTAHSAYVTPLGEIPVNREVVESLIVSLEKETGLKIREVSNDEEHSLEIELPFLQRVLKPGFQLLPIMLRDQSLSMSRFLADAIFQVLLKYQWEEPGQVILVASTDLSHYYPQARACALDTEILDRVKAFDPEGVIRVEEQGKGFACGRGALASVMWLAKSLGASRSKILKHATSGEISGDYSRVVGYAAAAFLR